MKKLKLCINILDETSNEEIENLIYDVIVTVNDNLYAINSATLAGQPFFCCENGFVWRKRNDSWGAY